MRAPFFVTKILVIANLILITLTTAVHADEAQCKSVLHDCDTAVQELQKETALQKQIIADEDSRFSTQTKELNSEQFWKPVALGAGIVVGVETLILILKK